MSSASPSGGGFTLRQLVPNFCTFVAACSGLTSIRFAIDQEFEWALAAILFAVLLDGLDGHLARLLDAQSKFGAEFDSLADFLSFGVAPAVLMFTWTLYGLNNIGWAVAVIFALACCLRLARFNSMLGTQQFAWQKDFFTGVPAPAGALLVLSPMYLAGILTPASLEMKGLGLFPSGVWLIALNTLAVAFLLVSTIPTYSAKIAVERALKEHLLPTLLLVAGLILILVTFPHATLMAVTVLYLCMIPWSVWRFRHLMAEELDEEDDVHGPRNAHP